MLRRRRTRPDPAVVGGAKASPYAQLGAWATGCLVATEKTLPRVTLQACYWPTREHSAGIEAASWWVESSPPVCVLMVTPNR
jgi:hypothetical protein